MRIIDKQALCTDDVLLVPQHSQITSRDNVDLSTRLGKMKLKLPIVSSNMDTITEGKMMVAMSQMGGAGILHRFATREEIFCWVEACVAAGASPTIISVGVTDTGRDIEHIHSISYDHGLDAICVDVAHGDHVNAIQAIKRLRGFFTNMDIIAGNVATPMGALRLIDAGANIIKIGVGGGSVCSTRIATGHGVPTFQSTMNIHDFLVYEGIRESVSLISDGGVRYSGDIVKYLAVGADAVMLGSLLAGTDEAAGDLIMEGGRTYKTFRGMASRETQLDKRSGRRPRVEGISVKIPHRGPVRDILTDLRNGICSGFSYSGATNIVDLRDAAEFIIVTSNTLKESHPHNPHRL